MLNENIKMIGIATMILRGSDGKIKQEVVKENLIVTTGRDAIAEQLMPSPSINKPSHMQLGTGTTSPVIANTALQTPISGRISLGSSRSTNKVTYSATFGAGVSTGAITEAGIFNSATAGAMYSRITFAVINKGASDSLELNWQWTIGA